jgi:hypothetical protein
LTVSESDIESEGLEGLKIGVWGVVTPVFGFSGVVGNFESDGKIFIDLFMMF